MAKNSTASMSLQQSGPSSGALLDPPLPTDPVELAAFWKRVDAAVEDFEAGRCIPWEQVDAQISRDLAL